jgi:hypothetical protein
MVRFSTMQASESRQRARQILEIYMFQSILLPTADVVALRAAVALPQFSALTHLVPGLTPALASPQPNFEPSLGLADNGVSEVRSNTNYLEDWDELSGAVNDARESRRKVDKVAGLAWASGIDSLKVFVLVSERMGSNDGPSFGKQVYFEFAAAQAALRAWVDDDFDSEEDPELEVREYCSPETSVFALEICFGNHIAVRYYLKGFATSEAA